MPGHRQPSGVISKSVTDVSRHPNRVRFPANDDSIDKGRMEIDAAVSAYLEGMVQVIRNLDASQLTEAFELLWRAWESDRAVFIIGNGGSASTASHMANDLSKQAQVDGRRPLRAH